MGEPVTPRLEVQHQLEGKELSRWRRFRIKHYAKRTWRNFTHLVRAIWRWAFA